MARILAIDTTGEFGSIALSEGRNLVEEMVLHCPEGYAQVLFTHIDQLLRRHATDVAGIDIFASASGPGSFTGVRVGLAAAKGLAEACNRPMVAVSNLKALAWHGTAKLRAVFMDARRGEIYGAVYDENLNAVTEERVMKFQAWIESLPEGEREFITPNPSLFPTIQANPAPRTLAKAIAAIAFTETPQDPASVDANYVRRSDAELLWKDPK